VERHDALAVLTERQRSQQQRVHDREDHRRRPDPEPERRECYERETRPAREPPRRAPQVGGEAVVHDACGFNRRASRASGEVSQAQRHQALRRSAPVRIRQGGVPGVGRARLWTP